MKKRSQIILTALFALLALCCSCLLARPTTEYEAEMVVKGWLTADPQPLDTKIGQQVRRVETFTNAGGETVYYIVYLHPSGFVIVSADDLVEPIIGFVAEGTYDPSPNNPLGALVTNDLKGRIAIVRSTFNLQAMAEAEELSLTDTQRKWSSFIRLAETPKDSIRLMGLPSICDVRVAPLTMTKWGQSKDKCGSYCYNYYTPNHYPSGCVATAMAQLMRYYEYPHEPNDYDPTQSDGKRKFKIKVDGVEHIVSLIGRPYSWNIMAPDPDCSTEDAQRQAIGAICYDAGISTESEYTSNETGTNNSKATNALRITFKYTNDIFGWNSNNNIGKEQLNGMVNPNLDAGYPVIFGMPRGQNSHAAVCDGYGYKASTLYHHLNMGWYGNNSVWYNLPNIDCSAPGPYQTITSCIYNIFPSGSGEIISGRVIDIYGNPIGEAIVTAKCVNNRYEATTNHNGIYALAKIPSATTYTISVTRRGFIFTDQNSVITGTSSDWENVSGNKWQVDFIGRASRIEISKSVEYYRDPSSRYNIDVALMADDTFAAASVVDPNGTMHPLNYEGEGEFCTEIIFDTAAQLAAFPSGDWVFTKYYTEGGSDITIVHYPYIPLVTQEPNLTYPRPNDTNIPLSVTFTWEPVTDQNVTNVELTWEPIDGCGLRGEVCISMPKTEMQYGPVMLSPNTWYELYLVFGRNYRGETSDDIYYVIDADSEQRYWFRTHAE